ncbi:hypothetical protein ACWDCC_28330 [Streptomyces sp. NPDC001102]
MSDHLVGRRLQRIIASWHRYAGARSGPLDVWLIDSDAVTTRLTTGSDWCLIVERATPYEGYDMGAGGRVEVASAEDETPFAAHLGETVVAVRCGAVRCGVVWCGAVCDRGVPVFLDSRVRRSGPPGMS